MTKQIGLYFRYSPICLLKRAGKVIANLFFLYYNFIMRKILALFGFLAFSSQVALSLDMVYPAGKYNKTIHNSVYFMGSLDKGETLYYQGEKVNVAKNGAFAFTVPLNNGRNQVFLKLLKDGRYSFKQYYITKEIQPVPPSGAVEFVSLEKTSFKTISDGVPLRSTPVDAGLNRMGHLAKDTLLIVDGKKGDFYRVYLSPTKIGWIDKKYVAKTLDANGLSVSANLATFYNIDDKTVPNLSLYRAAFTHNLPYEVIDKPNELTINIFNVANVKDETLVLRVAKSERIKYSTQFNNGDFVLLLKNMPHSTGLPLSGLNIVLDAGHGGSEKGAIGVFRDYEKDFNLAITKELKRMLEAQGANVYLTRVSDVEVSLDERSKFAKAHDADIFLSVHMNAVPQGADPNARSGSSVYYYNESAKSLANSVKDGLVAGLSTNDDGVHQESFAVLRHSDYLGVLAEVCYMVNPTDSLLYKSEDFVLNAAKSISEGVVNYYAISDKSKSKVGSGASKSDNIQKVKKQDSSAKVKNVKASKSVKLGKKSVKREKNVKNQTPFFDTSVREKYKQEAIYVYDENDKKWYRPKGKKKRAKRPPREIKNNPQIKESAINIFASGDYTPQGADYNLTPMNRCKKFFSKLGSYFYNGAKN